MRTLAHDSEGKGSIGVMRYLLIILTVMTCWPLQAHGRNLPVSARDTIQISVWQIPNLIVRWW